MRTVLCLIFLAACSSDSTDDAYGTDAPADETGLPADTGEEPGGDRVSTVLGLAGDEAAGESAFGAGCAGCHGADGSGGTGPNLNDRIPGLSDEQIVQTLLDGPGSMPSFASESDQGLADLHAFLVGSFR